MAKFSSITITFSEIAGKTYAKEFAELEKKCSDLSKGKSGIKIKSAFNLDLSEDHLQSYVSEFNQLFQDATKTPNTHNWERVATLSKIIIFDLCEKGLVEDTI